MDTMSAFAKGMANKGQPLTYFDENKIKEKMEEHGVKEAEIFFGGDRGATNSPVRLIDGEVHGHYMGVDGSTWATPILDINGTMYNVGTDEECNIIWDLDYSGGIKSDEN